MTTRSEDTGPLATVTVAHVIHSLGAGGAEQVLIELARAAPSAALRMIVIGLSDGRSDGQIDNRVAPQLRALGVKIYELHAARYDPTAVIRVAKILRAEKADVVHTHLKHADVVGGAAALLVRVPSVSTLHVIDMPTSSTHRLRVKFAARARRLLSDTVIALSSEQNNWYRRYAGAHPNVAMVPNGVIELQVSRDPASVRAEIGVTPETTLALVLSLMKPVKGHAQLLEAIRLIPYDVPVTFALAGDGPLLEEVRSTVEGDPSLCGRVRILGFRTDVADLLSACDFVVHPSIQDALPTALISALAAGRPIVATNVGGIPDIVGPGCGVLVEPANPSALCAAIVDMTELIRSEPTRAEDIRRASREMYESRFSADMWVNNLRKVYERAIGSGLNDAARDELPRRRIALVEFPPSGGLYQFALQLGEALARSGDEVEVITGPSPELTSREPGCRVRSLLPTWHPKDGDTVPEWWRRPRRIVRAGQHIMAWMVLLAYLARSRPDVIVWSAWRFSIDGLGVQLARKLFPRAVLALVAHEALPLVEQPGSTEMYKSSATMNRVLGQAYAQLDVAYALGESSKRALMQSWPVTGPVHIIPHGDQGIYVSTDVPPADATGPIALTFGTITKHKGLDTLCDAWPKVRSQLPAAELVIAGPLGANVDGQALRKRCASLDGVHLNIGYVPVPDVPSYFAKARCVVLPYKRGSQSGVAHLAHTLRRPVVATRVGDIPSVVQDEVSGLIVAPDDSDALAEAIVHILSDAEAARRMGDAGADALVARSSWGQVADQFRRGLPVRKN